MKQKTALPKWNTRRTVVLAVSLILLCLLSASAVTYGMFTNSMQAQRTIAAYDETGARFSSNLLPGVSTYTQGEYSDSVKTVYVTSNQQSPTAVVTVCNYDQSDKTRQNSNNITYTLSAELVKYDDVNYKYVAVDAAYLSANSLTAYTVTISNADGTVSDTLGGAKVKTTAAFGGTLANDEGHDDQYTVRFSTDFAVATPPNLYVGLTVTPTDESLPKLHGVIAPGLRAAGAVHLWQGSFSDSTSSAPSAYDGYNYVIEGTGSGTFTLKWDNTKVTLSDESILTLGRTPSTVGSVSTIEFSVNSDTTNHYDLQFYKKNITTETWATSMNKQLASAGASPLDAPATVVGYYFVP